LIVQSEVVLEKVRNELAWSSGPKWKCTIKHIPTHYQGHFRDSKVKSTQSSGCTGRVVCLWGLYCDSEVM